MRAEIYHKFIVGLNGVSLSLFSYFLLHRNINFISFIVNFIAPRMNTEYRNVLFLVVIRASSQIVAKCQLIMILTRYIGQIRSFYAALIFHY